MLYFFITTTVILLIPYLFAIRFVIRMKQKNKVLVPPSDEQSKDQDNSFLEFFQNNFQDEANHSIQEGTR